MIRKALEAEDELVTEVMRHAAEVLGYACVNVRHLIDPGASCSAAAWSRRAATSSCRSWRTSSGLDPLPGVREGGHVLLSALGDDAVVLGAVAAARTHVGRSPFKKKFTVHPTYPEITWDGLGEITVDGRTYHRDIYISVTGKVKKRDEDLAKDYYGSTHAVGPRELEKVCKGGPEVLFVGAGTSHKLELTEEARRFLAQRSIQLATEPTDKAVDSYNRSKLRKATLLHVTC